jgi:hypothetical protein
MASAPSGTSTQTFEKQLKPGPHGWFWSHVQWTRPMHGAVVLDEQWADKATSAEPANTRNEARADRMGWWRSFFFRLADRNGLGRDSPANAWAIHLPTLPARASAATAVSAVWLIERSRDCGLS